MAVAAQLDLNGLDSLSRTCRGVHDSLLQYRTILLRSTVHCVNEELPVDPESTLRYRARAGNWYYMEDTSRSSYYNGKAGSCARDMVSQCRKCSTVVCRVSFVPRLPPPSPAVLRLTRSPAARIVQSNHQPLLSCATDIAGSVSRARRHPSAAL